MSERDVRTPNIKKGQSSSLLKLNCPDGRHNTLLHFPAVIREIRQSCRSYNGIVCNNRPFVNTACGKIHGQDRLKLRGRRGRGKYRCIKYRREGRYMRPESAKRRGKRAKIGRKRRIRRGGLKNHETKCINMRNFSGNMLDICIRLNYNSDCHFQKG